MTQEQLTQRDIDLDVNVTPEVEDAFYFLNSLENPKVFDADDDNISVEDYEKMLADYYDPIHHASERLTSLPKEEAWKAIRQAYRMIDNIKKYGVPCKQWNNN